MDKAPLQSADVAHSIDSSLVEKNNVLKADSKIKVIRQSTILAVGAVGIFASYSGVINLQSTLNFEQSIGTTSLALCFATAIIANATIAAIILQRVGAKVMIVFSEATFILFSLANIYPSKLTLYPAAVMLGLGEAFIWPAVMTFNRTFACAVIESGTSSKLSLSKENLEKKIRWFSGRFYSIFSAYLIIGNLMAFVIFKFDHTENVKLGRNQTNSSSVAMFSFCGVRDCYYYDDNSSLPNKMELSNYTLRYVLFAGYTFLQLCCCVLHVIWLLEPTRLYQRKAYNHERRPSTRAMVSKIVPDFAQQLTNPKQVLLLPLTLYNGMMVGFIFGDFTRSYIACAFSVHEIGLLMTLFGVTAALTSYAYQLSSRFVSRNCCIGIGLTLEAFILLWCFLWKASEFNTWQIYAIAALFGVSDSVRETSLSAIYPAFFGDDGPMGLNFMPMFTAAGLAIMFAISTQVCLVTKLIALSALLAFSIFSFGVLALRFPK